MSGASITCAAARARLHAFLDSELGMGDHALVRAHLDDCAGCGVELEDFRAVGGMLRGQMPAAVPAGALASMTSRVVSLAAAEARQSVRSRLSFAFDDMRFVFAGAGSFAATLVCALGLAALLHYGSRAEDDSLASLMARMSTPGSTANPLSVDPRILPPTVRKDSLVMPAILVNDVPYLIPDDEYAFAAVVTAEGRIAGVKMLPGQKYMDPRAVELLSILHGARFEPARLKDGRRVAISFVWVHSDLTIKPIKSS
ncbi:MAG: zf-HC2 domain-containing protein [Acidobacteriota bacterium]|nr:zf-HC2 domain-containing protein [Acidobacteriota bacterium]